MAVINRLLFVTAFFCKLYDLIFFLAHIQLVRHNIYSDNKSFSEKVVLDNSQNNNNDSAGNNPEYFLYLLTPIQGRLYAFILSRWPNKSDADDIMQETISVLWRKFHTYEPGTEFTAWAFTVTRYVLSGFKRKHSKYPVQFTEETLSVLDKHASDFDKSYDNRIETLRDCIKKLSGKELSLLKLKYEEGLPSQKIASRFGMSIRTFYRNISKTHAAILRCMDLNGEVSRQ